MTDIIYYWKHPMKIIDNYGTYTLFIVPKITYTGYNTQQRNMHLLRYWLSVFNKCLTLYNTKFRDYIFHWCVIWPICYSAGYLDWTLNYIMISNASCFDKIINNGKNNFTVQKRIEFKWRILKIHCYFEWCSPAPVNMGTFNTKK